ncbi:hypothetical protein [Streptomyces sp. NPDC051665]|uniref:hypothetical protein n=1 Tax=Streptomyces sp. NPDC051665 TaxID=3154647 RepID=UPI00342DC360
MILNGGDPVTLKGISVKFLLESSIRFTVIEQQVDVFGRPVSSSDRYKVSTRGYWYTIMNADGAEIIAWHWHPDGKSDVDYAHAHIGAAALNPAAPISHKDHLRTGRMSFENVASNLLDLGVTPMNLNYAEILSENRTAFEKWKTWG